MESTALKIGSTLMSAARLLDPLIQKTIRNSSSLEEFEKNYFKKIQPLFIMFEQNLLSFHTNTDKELLKASIDNRDLLREIRLLEKILDRNNY